MKTKTLFPDSFIFIFLLWSLSCASGLYAKLPAQNGEKEYLYKVMPVKKAIKINADWSKKVWNNTQGVSLKNYMGNRPDHFPDVEAKLRYDDRNIYVVFRVKDQYVRAVAKQTHGKVWEDSCVEFFFTPGPDISRGYFNLETNCKGVFLLGYTKNAQGERGLVNPDDCKMITIAHSLNRDTETEITEPVTWVNEYAIPFELLNKYSKVDKPAKGVQWRANFYKCADKTSHPHWLTWSRVINPTPRFHMPEYFGWLEF